MILGGYHFEHICDLEPVRRPDGILPAPMPQERYAKRDLYLNKATGVYLFADRGTPVALKGYPIAESY